jgi:hypothetical protein
VFKRPLLKEIFFLSIVIAVLHYIALTLFFYWTVSWFDIFMHLLGGFIIGLIAVFILLNNFRIGILEDKKVTLVLVLSFVMIVGLGWELWELFFGLTNILEDKVDTIVDLIMDFIGGYFAFLYGKKYLWIKN